MVTLGLLFVGTTLLLFATQAAESFDAALRGTGSPEISADLRGAARD